MQPDKAGRGFRDICHKFFAATSLSIATVVSACGENLGNSSSFDKSKPLTKSYQIANALADSGKHREAVIHYKRIISIGAKEDRQWIKVNSALGHSLFKLGLYDAAIKSEDEVIKFFPDDPIPYSNKAW